ncbi:MAG: hypothetical protein WAX04_03375 [Oscillospiraceae bacterium]
MKKKLSSLVVFVLSAISLLISLILFWNMGIYVDEANTSPVVVYGGDFGLNMAWLRLALLAIVTIISAVKLFRKQRV